MLIKTKQQRQKLSQMLVVRFISLYKRLYDCKVNTEGKNQAYVYIDPDEKSSIEVWFNPKNIYYTVSYNKEDVYSGELQYKRMLSETIEHITSIILKRREQYEKGIGFQEGSC